MTFRTKGVDYTNAPPMTHNVRPWALIFWVDVQVAPLPLVRRRPPEPDPFPPCGRHKWMAPSPMTEEHGDGLFAPTCIFVIVWRQELIAVVVRDKFGGGVRLWVIPLNLVVYIFMLYRPIYSVSEKTVQNCFCQNFVKFPSIVIIFAR